MLCSHCSVKWFSLDGPSTFWQICDTQYLHWVLLAVQWTVRTVHWVVCSLRQPLHVYKKCDWDTKLLICCVICFLKRSALRVCSTPRLQFCSKSSSPEHCTSKHDSSVPVGWTQDNDTHKHTITHIVLLYNKRKVYTHFIIRFLKRSAALRVCSTPCLPAL